MPKIEIFTKPNCIQCKMSKEKIKNQGLKYIEHNVEKEPELINTIKNEMGYHALPVIVVHKEDGTSYDWFGFRPDLIKKLTA